MRRPRRARGRSVAVILALAFAAGADPAAGQTAAPADEAAAKARAQALLKEGTALYQIGDRVTALDKFTAAYAAFPSPKLFFNIGQSHRELGQPTQAMEAFQRFVAEVPDPPEHAQAEAKRAIAELERMLVSIEITCPVEGADITVDGRSVGTTPLARFVWVLPGPHSIAARKPGLGIAVEPRRLAAGDHAIVELQPRAPPPPVPVFADPAAPAPVASAQPPRPTAQLTAVRPAAPAPRRRIWTWVAAGAAGAMAVGAVSTGLSVRSRFLELRDKCGSGSRDWKGCPDSDIRALESKRDLTNLLWVGTGILAVSSGVLFHFEGRAVEGRLSVSDGGALVAVGGRF